MVHSNQVVSVTSKEVSAVCRPGEAGAVGDLSVLANGSNVEFDLVNHALGLQVPDLDALGGSGTQPVSVGRKHKGVDDITSLKRIESLALSEVPEHGSAILSTGSAKGAIGRDSDGVEVSVVPDEVGAELAVGERPNLDKSVPSSRYNDRGGRGRRESHT